MMTWANHLHSVTWRTARRTPLGERLWQDRASRVGVLALVHILAALILAVVSPLWLMLIAPLLLGVPHVLSDLRHLVLNPPNPLARGLVPGLLLPLGAMTILRIVAIAGGPVFPTIEIALGFTALAVGIALAPARPPLRILAAVCALIVAGFALSSPRQTALILAHLHNAMAVAIWFFWTRNRDPQGTRWLVVACVIASVIILGSGLMDPLVVALGASQAIGPGLSFQGMVQVLAPDLNPTLGFRLVLIFAFAQAVHYSMWLWLIPSSPDIRPSATPLTPTERLTGWRKDFGWPAFAVGIIAVVALPLSGWFEPMLMRSSYLSLVLFHGWLEIAILAHFLMTRSHATTPA